MKPAKESSSVDRELAKILAPTFPGITVELAHSARWNRPCVTFRSREFTGLLPEERYHRLVAVIPSAFREENMAGLIWVELAEGESLEEFLKLPRSEDVSSREKKIYSKLMEGQVFDLLAESMGPSPDKRCHGNFEALVSTLSSKRFSPAGVTDAKLLMIRHHAYCDCQVLLTAWPALRRLFADAA